MKAGDLVKRTAIAIPRPEIFLVLGVAGDYSGNPHKTHEMTLKLWEVTGPTDDRLYSPMNLYEVVNEGR